MGKKIFYQKNVTIYELDRIFDYEMIRNLILNHYKKKTMNIQSKTRFIFSLPLIFTIVIVTMAFQDSGK